MNALNNYMHTIVLDVMYMDSIYKPIVSPLPLSTWMRVYGEMVSSICIKDSGA